MSRIAEAAEILRDAVFALCDDRPLVERLAHMHGVLERLEPDVLPERFRFRFEELRADFAFGADTIADALARMSGEDRRRLGERVARLYGDVMLSLHDDEH